MRLKALCGECKFSDEEECRQLLELNNQWVMNGDGSNEDDPSVYPQRPAAKHPSGGSTVDTAASGDGASVAIVDGVPSQLSSETRNETHSANNGSSAEDGSSAGGAGGGGAAPAIAPLSCLAMKDMLNELLCTIESRHRNDESALSLNLNASSDASPSTDSLKNECSAEFAEDGKAPNGVSGAVECNVEKM